MGYSILIESLAYLTLEASPDIRIDKRSFFFVLLTLEPLLDALQMDEFYRTNTLASWNNRIIWFIFWETDTTDWLFCFQSTFIDMLDCIVLLHHGILCHAICIVNKIQISVSKPWVNFIIKISHDIAPLALQIYRLNFSDGMILGCHISFIFITFDLHFFNSESDSAKLYDVSKTNVEPVGKRRVQFVIGIPHDLPSHVDMIFVRILLNWLVMEKPILIMLVNKRDQILKILTFVLVYSQSWVFDSDLILVPLHIPTPDIFILCFVNSFKVKII